MKDLFRWPQRLYWMFRATFAQTVGRWHYFRDAPDWVVFETAVMGNPEDGPTANDVRGIRQCAEEEAYLRIRRLKQKIEAAVKESEV